MLRPSASLLALVALFSTEEAAAQPQPWCVPGTQFCAETDGKGGIRIGGAAQGQAGPQGASAAASGHAGAQGDANANANAGAGGSYGGQGQSHYGAPQVYSRPSRFGVGSTFCATAKAGLFSGVKLGGCYALSFRTEPLFFEMEAQLLFGGERDTIDLLFPMSFVIPLTEERTLYQGLQLRVGGTPIGATFAEEANGGNYVRFGLHAGLTYEWAFSDVAAWRVFDARAFLDFGTRREVDERGNFMDFGGQLGTGIVF